MSKFNQPEDKDLSCNQCEATMINNILFHEVGCVNRNKMKYDGEWIVWDEAVEFDISIKENRND